MTSVCYYFACFNRRWKGGKQIFSESNYRWIKSRKHMPNCSTVKFFSSLTTYTEISMPNIAKLLHDQYGRLIKSALRVHCHFIRTTHMFQSMGENMGESCNTGWCGKNFQPRVFTDYEPVVCYDKPPAANPNRTHYDTLRYNCLMGDKIQVFEVPKKSARTWEMKKDDLCRITVTEGPQVGDMNFWNLHNKKERFYSGKTRQIHASHLTIYDRLWSNLPYLRSMATIVGDSLKNYGVDKDGGSVHDVIGTRCDDYTYKLITGKERSNSCHTFLTNAVKKLGMEESDVHDVWNIFMCTGFNKEHQYFCKPSPAQKGDYIEFIADMDLLVALSTCPQGNVSTPVGQEVPDNKCFPLLVEVYRQKK